MGTNYSMRIPLEVFIVLNGLLMGLALLMAAARMVIRFRFQRKLLLDDFVLIFACSIFIASQLILYIIKIENLYWFGSIAFEPMDPQNLASRLEDPEAFNRRVLRIERAEFSSLALTFTSIFAVKICFLVFFHEMITRLRRLILVWKVIFGITVLFWALCTSAVFISCPHFASSVSTYSYTRSIASSIITALLDIASDLLVLSIPLILLWKVKIKRKQKIFFGIFLCLNVCMIIIVIVRISGFVVKNTLDLVWIVFWHQAEGAIAIITVSLTAFRSVLGIKALKAKDKKKLKRSWLSHRPQLLPRYFKKETQDESKAQELPSIPGATLTGMRTFINGNGIWDESIAVGMTDKSGMDWPGAFSHESQEIEVAHISTELNVLDGAERERAADFV